MSRARVAPTLRQIIRATNEETVWDKSWAKPALNELRALVSVYEHASECRGRGCACHPESPFSRMDRALRRADRVLRPMVRLSRVSRKGERRG